MYKCDTFVICFSLLKSINVHFICNIKSLVQCKVKFLTVEKKQSFSDLLKNVKVLLLSEVLLAHVISPFFVALRASPFPHHPLQKNNS